MKITSKKAQEIQFAIDMVAEARRELDEAAAELEQLTNREIEAANFERCTVQNFFDWHTRRLDNSKEFRGAVEVAEYGEPLC